VATLIHHPEAFLWGAAEKAATAREFRFSLRCEAALKDHIHSGMELHRVGRFEFKERANEAAANMQKLVDLMIDVELSLDRYAEFIQESTLFIALYQYELCPGLWPLC
jgi:hypothetical protein